ncbi:MAG: hypothetical protein Q8O33_12265 [Pseudomonadota bacterium]|nr:hypothetical protein [Pseudomonadota bacterium]
MNQHAKILVTGADGFIGSHLVETHVSEALTLAACRTLVVESEKRPRGGQFLPDSPPHSRTKGQEAGEKWAVAVDLQPTIPKSDRLLRVDAIKIRDYLSHHTEQGVGLCVNRVNVDIIRALVPMHIFGHPVDVNGLPAVARDFNPALIEDAAELQHYKTAFATVNGIRLVSESEQNGQRDALLQATISAGLMTHTAWVTMHELTPLKYCPNMDLAGAQSLSHQLLNVQSSSGLAPVAL